MLHPKVELGKSTMQQSSPISKYPSIKSGLAEFRMMLKETVTQNVKRYFESNFSISTSKNGNLGNEKKLRTEYLSGKHHDLTEINMNESSELQLCSEPDTGRLIFIC